MYRAVILLLFFITTHVSWSQCFSVDDTVKNIYKSTLSSTPPHEYFQLYNNSGNDINMRWKVNHSETFYPPQWQIAVQDNVTYHNPAPDSADFVLPDTVGAMDKIIINIYHNGIAGNGVYAVDLINLDSVSEVITVKFVIEIYYQNDVLSAGIIPLQVYPNPCLGYLQVKSVDLYNGNTRIFLLSGDGRQIEINKNQLNSSNIIDLNNIESGFYMIIAVDQLNQTKFASPLIVAK